MKKEYTILLCTALLVIDLAKAEVKPNSLFSDNAVLQRNVTVPVWGTAKDGEKIIVEFGKQKVQTVAQNGKWMITLKPLKAGGPFAMTIKGDNTVVINNILVGEVWVCSGQSNMERQLGLRSGQKPIVNWEKEAAEANYPEIRELYVGLKSSGVPLTDVNSKWVVCSPTTVKDFTAVGFFFGRSLYQQIKVPIGLLFTAFGGTPAENWTSRAALENNPELKKFAQDYDRAVNNYGAQVEKYKTELPVILEKFIRDSAAAKQDSKPLPRKPTPPRDPATTGACGGLYNAMIAPLQPYAIAGAIWYQGEANNGAARAKQYQTLFPAMITDWRRTWKMGDFPFLFVQIAPFKAIGPEIREAQLLCWQKTSNTAMVVTTDYGDSGDIHPSNKRPVGERLALAARALAYKEKLEYSGPVYQSMTIKDSLITLEFTHIGKGLMAKEGLLKGFIIAGKDNNFISAKAKIKGDKIIVYGEGVTAPVAVRFGWANVPDVNLFNQAGLPASPFRTDVE